MVVGNLKGITLPQSNSQQIVGQYVDDTSFMVKAEENGVVLPLDLRLIGIKVWHTSASEDIHRDGWKIPMEMGCCWGFTKTFRDAIWFTIGTARC